MDCDRLLLRLSCLQELRHDIFGWGCSVQEVQVKVLYTIFSKFLFLILGLIQAYDEADIHFLEDGNVVFGREGAVPVGHVQWSREGDELSGQNPI